MAALFRLFKQSYLFGNIQIHHQYIDGFFPENTEKLALRVSLDNLLQRLL